MDDDLYLLAHSQFTRPPYDTVTGHMTQGLNARIQYSPSETIFLYKHDLYIQGTSANSVIHCLTCNCWDSSCGCVVIA